MESDLQVVEQLQEKQISGLDLDEALKRNKRVLIVDDDADTVLLLKKILRIAEFDVASALNGVEAAQIAEQINPDVILLDLMMPEVDGKTTFTKLRQVTQAPVIVVSAMSDKDLVAELLNLGTDDFVTKPFNRNELVARIKAVLRRGPHRSIFDGVSIPEIGMLINFSKREVQYQGKIVHLSPMEFSLVQLLAKNLPHIVSYDEIAETLWGNEQVDHKNRIKYIVHLIRKKFLAINPDHAVIVTADRFGYRLFTN